MKNFICSITLVFLLGNAYAQQKGEKYLEGQLSSTNSFSSDGIGGGLSGSSQTSQTGNLEIDMGYFYRDLASFHVGILLGIGYTESWQGLSGTAFRNRQYQFGGVLGNRFYFPFTERLYGTLGNNFLFMYTKGDADNGAAGTYHSSVSNYLMIYTFVPGLYYRVKPWFALRTSVKAANISLGFLQSSTNNSPGDRNSFNYGVLSNLNVSSLEFAFMFFPFRKSQAKP